LNGPVLRICVIGSTYPRFHDDPVVPWLRESVARLARRGHEVTVVAPAFEGLESHAIDGVRVLRFRYAPRGIESLTHDEGAPSKVRNPLYKLLAPGYVVSGAAHLLAWSASRAFDVLHVHWPFPHGLIAEATAAFRGVPRVATCHGSELAMARRSPLIAGVLRRSLLQTEVLSCNSSHTLGEIRRLCGRDAAIVPYGSTVDCGRDAYALRPSNDPAILMFSGRLIQRKGIDYLIRALPRVLERRSVELVITGDGERRGEWESLAASLGLTERVRFLGFVTAARLAELYRSCDVYVHPAIFDDNNDTEGLGVVLVEALANRCPVVASEVGGIVDVIHHEKTGLLVPEKDERALADAIVRLLEDRALAAQLASAGAAFAQQHFDWERITDETQALYEQAIASG
jgi:glycosyltransferase involved in cell wall biosynthesis